MSEPVRCGCGGEAMLYVSPITTRRLLQCESCKIETAFYDSEAEAIEAWNMAMGERTEDRVCQLCDCYDKQRCYCNLHGIWVPSDFYCKSWEPEGTGEDE